MKRRVVLIVLMAALAMILVAPEALAYGDIAAIGATHTFATDYESSAAIGSDGCLYTWGWNAFGQLGLGDTDDRNTPQRVPGLKDVVSVPIGDHKCAVITSDGSLYLWGWRASNTFEFGNYTDITRPKKVPGLSDVAAISLGGYANAALTSDGRLFTWGSNDYGQLALGIGEVGFSPREVTDFPNVKVVSFGYDHSIAATFDGRVFTWGNNDEYKLGLGDKNRRYTPQNVPGLLNVISVSAGRSMCAALTSDGSVYTWGYNDQCHLGLGDNATRKSPQKVTSLPVISTISTGRNHCSAITQYGSMYIWGNNECGKLGLGDKREGNLPKPVPGLTGVVECSLGRTTSAALTSDGNLYLWGDNRYGQLGLGDFEERHVPTLCMKNVKLPQSTNTPVVSDGVSIRPAGGFSQIKLNCGGILKPSYFITRSALKTPVTNAIVNYSITLGGAVQTGTGVTDNNGMLVIDIPGMTRADDGKYVVVTINSVDGYAVTFSHAFVIKVTEPTLKQTWLSAMGVNGKASVGFDLGGSVPGAKFEAGLSGASVSGKRNNTLKLMHDWKGNGTRTLEVENQIDSSVGSNIKAGLYSSVDFPEGKLKLTGVEISGGGALCGNLTTKIKIDDYSGTPEQVGKFSKYLLAAILACSDDNIVSTQLTGLLTNDFDFAKGYGLKTTLESGATLAGAGAGKLDGSLFKLSDKSVFDCQRLNWNDSGTELSSGFKMDTKARTLDFKYIVKGSFNAADLLNSETKFVYKQPYNAPTELDIKVIQNHPNFSILGYSVVENDVYNYKFTGGELNCLISDEPNLAAFTRGELLYIAPLHKQAIAECLVKNNITGDTSIIRRGERAFELDLCAGAKMVLGFELGLNLKGLHSEEYEKASGIFDNGSGITLGDSSGCSEPILSKRVSVDALFNEAFNNMVNHLVNLVVNAVGSAVDGIINGLASINKTVCDFVVSITTPKTPVSMQQSYVLTAMDAGDNEYAAVTIGQPYVVYVEDANGNEVTDFAATPMPLTIAYDDAGLANAGLNAGSALLGSIKLYRYEAETGCYRCMGGTHDAANRKVSLDITLPGQYILAVDNLAPDIENFKVSNATSTPTITAAISDMSGLDESTFSFKLDGVEKLSGAEAFHAHFNYSSGVFTYAVTDPLAEGAHTAELSVSDTSGNALPQFALLNFTVSASQAELPEGIRAGYISGASGGYVLVAFEAPALSSVHIHYTRNGSEYSVPMRGANGVWRAMIPVSGTGDISWALTAYDGRGYSSVKEAVSTKISELPALPLGDVDASGQITASDAQTLRQLYLLAAASDYAALADVNSDGVVDTEDVLELQSLLIAA